MAKKRPTRKTGKSRKMTPKRPPVKRTAARKPPARKPPARKPSAPKTARRAIAPPAPAPNAVRQLAQRIVDLTVSHNDEASFALYADFVESAEPGMPPTVGIDAIKQKFAMWRSMVSESAWQARNVWVDGNAIIIEWSGRVTVAGTGKQVELNEIAIHEVQGGKIVRERFYYDPRVMQP